MGAKVCKICAVEKPVSLFYKSKSCSDGLQSHCIYCERVRQRHYYVKNRNHFLSKAAKYRKTEAGIKSKRKYAQSEKGRSRNAKYLKFYNKIAYDVVKWRETSRRNREKLTNGYVKQVIISLCEGVLTRSDIPDALVEIKRQSIFLKRLVRQKKQQNEQSDTTTNI